MFRIALVVVGIIMVSLVATSCAVPPTSHEGEDVGRTRIRVNSFICILAFCQHEMEVADSGTNTDQTEGAQDADIDATIPVVGGPAVGVGGGLMESAVELLD